MLTDGFSEFYHTQAVRIMGMAVVQCLAGSILNTLRGIKIRFADFQMDHMNPLTFHFVGPLQNVHNDKRGHFFGSMGYHFK